VRMISTHTFQMSDWATLNSRPRSSAAVRVGSVGSILKLLSLSPEIAVFAPREWIAWRHDATPMGPWLLATGLKWTWLRRLFDVVSLDHGISPGFVHQEITVWPGDK
jgi:hypothetical protein